MRDQFYVVRIGSYFYQGTVSNYVTVCERVTDARKFNSSEWAKRECTNGIVAHVTLDVTIEEVPS